MKDLWQLKREFLEYCEIEKGQSLLTVSNYERYLNRFLTWLKSENPKSEISDLGEGLGRDGLNPKEIQNPKSKIQNNNTTIQQYNNIFPQDIDRETIRKYRLYVNRLRDRQGKELKSTTQNHHVLALRAFLRYLALQGIKTIASEEINLARPGDRKINFLMPEEYQKLLSAPKDNLRDRAILELLFSTGMRVSELISLNIEDINFNQGEIAVLGKGKKVRVVFLSESATRALVKYLEKRGALKIISNSKFLISKQIPNPKSQIPDQIDQSTNQPINQSTKCIVHDSYKKMPLFLSLRNHRMNVRGVERLVQKYAKIAGITKSVSPHTLRHTFATDLLIAGADIRSVQSLLGHSNISTTQVYTHVTDQHLREVHKKYHKANNKDSTTTDSFHR